MRASKALRIVGIFGITPVLVAGLLFAAGAPAAYAKTKYPTWADVVAARHSQERTQSEVSKIKNLLKSLTKKLATAQTTAATDGQLAYVAQQNYFAGEQKEQNLQAQVKTATAKAARSKTEISEYAAELARGADVPGGDSLSLFLNRDSASDVLNGLGNAQKLTEQQNKVLQLAVTQEKSISQLRALATAQAGILKGEKQAADAAEAIAVASAQKLQTAVTADAAHKKQLKIELVALTTKRHLTEKQYEKGLRVAAASGGVGGSVASSGWALPTVGVITSPWGYRFDPAAGYAWRMHYGDDIADGCFRPIYAAHSGVVSYVGPYGDIGNYVEINHGNGIVTAYGHIADGKTFVRIGERVSAGREIAATGSTGISTGCHLYFQVFVNGGPVNPVPFMSARGVRLG
jgi:murein DD-endopeptidase MepM/ murein hydrolase activator NlpD